MSGADVSGLKSFEAIVADYLHFCAPETDRETRWYGARDQALPSAVARAAESMIPRLSDGRPIHHPHQRRIRKGVLPEARARLLDALPAIADCPDFESLYDLVRRRIAGLAGVGEILIYDIAHRIGAFLGLEPERVYLHGGTELGAKALELPTREASLAVSELPGALQVLTASQNEDLLCIYRVALGRVHRGQTAVAHASGCGGSSPTGPSRGCRRSAA